MLNFKAVQNSVRKSAIVRLVFGCSAAAALVGLSVSAQAGQIIGNDMGKCSASSGPGFIVDVTGFRGNSGRIRVQAYPATPAAWLAKGAWVTRIDVPVHASGGKMRFCLPVPAAGKYGVAVRHDLNSNGKTDLMSDGGGFSNNPKLSIFNLGKPSFQKVSISVPAKPVTISVALQYM